jgi:hypothetical protein
MLSESKKESKTLQNCSSEHYSKLFSPQFLDSAIFILKQHSKLHKVPHPSKISDNASARSCFLRCDIRFVPPEYIKSAGMWPVDAQFHCSNYIWQLHVSDTN